MSTATLAAAAIHPHGDRILVKRREEVTQVGAIHVPDAHREKPMEGIVLAVGPGGTCAECREATPMRIEVGQRVLFGRFSGQEFVFSGQTFVLMREDEVLATLDGEAS